MKRILTAVGIMLASMFIPATISAQNGYQVKGVVVDNLGPVIGATVLEQGTSNGTTTGLDGDFALKVSSADATVEISCIGYASQAFKASELPATITLSEDALFLEDAIVIGYGTVKKSDLTGSVATIKADEINRGAITSPDQMLMGKVAGLLVTPASGQPGASATIRIRGAASLNASNDPLIVIDGVPITGDGGAGMGNPLASVNPADIESYSVLKDASAAAIYGSRASNGVIMITTKKGAAGAGAKKVKVNYTGSVSVKQNYQFFDMMNGQEYADFVKNNYAESASLLGYNGEIYDTDWQKEIYRLAINTDHNVSAYGGQVVPFRVSLGYNLDQATIKVGDNQRANLDVSLSPTLLDKHLSVNFNVKGIYQKTNWADGGSVGGALAFNPTKPVRFTEDVMNAAGDAVMIPKGTLWNWYGPTGDPNTMASSNPLGGIYEYYNANSALRSIGNLQLDYKIHGFEDLRINANLGYDIAKLTGEKYNTIGSRNAKASSPDIATQYGNFNRNIVMEVYADYAHEFGKSNVDVMLGHSLQDNLVSYDNWDYYNREPRWDEADIYKPNVGDKKSYALMSFFGRANYGYASKYLVTATFRVDGSSRFSPKNRWGLFPSLALAWNAKNEDFLKDISAIDELKLRLGWGRTGQQDLGGEYYPYLARYIFGTNAFMAYNMGDANYMPMGPNPYNPNLKWETTETYNIGVDYSVLKQKVSGSVELYYRKTYDLLNSVPTPLGTNFSNKVLANVGNMANKGIEINANWNVIETHDWHFSVGGNVTFQDIKITKLLSAGDESDYPGVQVGSTMGSNEGYSSLYKSGWAPYTFYLYKQLYDQNGEPIFNALYDISGDGEITEEDRYLTGKSPNPWMFYGLNMHLSYKNWDFSLNGHGSVGNYAINKVRKGYSTAYGLIDETSKGYINNLNNTYLRKDWYGTMTTPQAYSDLWIENASFFKIDDINAGYTFKLGKPWINSVRVAASIQNVCTLTPYSGLDPELTSVDGVDNNFIPRPRLYTLRVNINF